MTIVVVVVVVSLFSHASAGRTLVVRAVVDPHRHIGLAGLVNQKHL